MAAKKSKDEELRAAAPEDEKDKDAASDGGDASPEGDAAAEGEGPKKSKVKKIILFVMVPLLLLGGIGAGLYFSGMLDKLVGKKPVAEGAAEAGNPHNKKAEVKLDEHGNPIGAYFLQIPDMLVNLRSDNGQNRYLRLSVQLELGSEEDKKAVEAVMPRVIDQFQTYLRELRVKDLRGSAGIYRLQMELLNRVNEAAAPVEVKDVLFQQILIQ
jgi:flagellar FliL protein